MPVDTTPPTPKFLIKPTASSTSLHSGLPTAVQIMSTWRPEQWESPDRFGEFPLLRICPDALGYFAKAGHFTNKDLKKVSNILGEHFDPNKPDSLYSKLIVKLEPNPWVFAFLEANVVQGRGTQNGPKRGRPVLKERVFGKLPLSKLRLGSHPELHDRVHELLLDDVEPALAVAAFCEYAIMNYHHLTSDTEDDNEHFEKANEILSYRDPTDYVETRLPLADECKGWYNFGGKVASLLDIEPDAASDLILISLHTAIKGLADDLEVGSLLENPKIELLSDLTRHSQTIHEALVGKATELTIKRLRHLEVLSEDSDHDQYALEPATVLLTDRFYQLILRRNEKIDETNFSIETLSQKIADAADRKEFSKVGELANSAEELKRKLARMSAAYDGIISVFNSLRDETPDRFISLVEGFDPARDSDIFDEDSDSSDFQKFFEQNRRESIERARIEQSVGKEILSDRESEHHTPEEEVQNEPKLEGQSEDSISNEGFQREGGSTRQQHDEASIVEEIEMPVVSSAAPNPQPESDGATLPNDLAIESTDETPTDVNCERVEDVKTKPQLEGKSTASASATPINNEAPIPLETFTRLIERDHIGIAADAAEAFETEGQSLPLPASALRVAAASRAPHRGFDKDIQKFNELIGVATSEPMSDLASVIILGAMLRPAILSKDTTLRTQIKDLCKGTLGQHLIKVNDTVSRLDYKFPPKPDKLAEFAGKQGIPQRQRLAGRLTNWCRAFGKKKSRWPFATEFMHHVVSPSGVLGAAVAAISKKQSNVLALAGDAVQSLSSPSAIEALSEEFATNKGYKDLALYSKGVEYLVRQFDEPVALLESWIDAAQANEASSQQNLERLQRTVATLSSQLDKAITGLDAEVEKAENPLVSAIAMWIIDQIKASRQALLGQDTGTFSTVEEALTAERDLLPPSDSEALENEIDRAAIFKRVLNDDLILDQGSAIKRACSEGAFETAFRMVNHFDVASDEAVKEAVDAFVEAWRPEVERRERHLTALDKVDYKNQDEINRQRTWCKITLGKLNALVDGTEVHNVADITERVSLLDQTIADIEANIREDQINRINEYRKAENEEDVDNLLSALGDLTNEAIEDRIAQLRDGRSAAVFEMDLSGLIGEFTPNFIPFACSKAWPTGPKSFESALSEESGLLHTEEDRRAAAITFINMFRDIMTGMRTKRPIQSQIREIFEEIGFERVSVSKFTELGRKGSWSASLNATIRSDGWFLPPTFGSGANNGYNLILASAETLPETMIKTIGESDRPAIVFLSGVADISRRHEIAERLRGKALPALLIDEALIAFAATRRDTRARTIFECGLPYGRIEPYTTDAGQLPPEMFFGREDEVRKIISKTADGCLVYGGRQLGKSALLAHIAQTQHDPEAKRVIVNREVKPLGNSEETSEIWRHISSMLPNYIVKPDHTAPEEVVKDIQSWVSRNPSGRIICMFDEADNFMTRDTRDDYPQLSKLKELMEKTQRAFKVVFAGLHNVQRMHKQPNSPLWHLGEPICIGPLNRNIDDKRAAFDLVVSPMRAAGFGFENTQAVEEILTWANYYPSLVQEYMKGFLATMNGTGSGESYKLPTGGPLWRIPSDTLFAHRGFNHIEVRIRDKFHLTLNLDPRYALVAYTLARLINDGEERQALITGLSPRKLMDEAHIFWPKTSEAPTLPAFEALLEELFDLGVLGRNPTPGSENRFNYLLRTREVAAMLGSGNDIYHALDEIENKDPSISYDRATHRRRYRAKSRQALKDWPYTPLSDLQIERITSPDTTPVQIICGLKSLGLGKVTSSLKWISEEGHFSGMGKEKIFVEKVNSKNDLRHFIDKVHPSAAGVTILIYEIDTVDEANAALTWLETQQMVLNHMVRPLILFNASNPALRALAIRRKDQTQFLSPWGAEMIRVHLDNIEKTNLDTPELRAAILDATGGIPTEVTALINDMANAENPSAVVENWKPNIKLPDGFLNDTEKYALWVLNETDDFKFNNEMLIERTGTDFESIGPDLQAFGLIAPGNHINGQYQLSVFGRMFIRLYETRFD